jgi:hypothetical protein
MFTPNLSILPEPQRELWAELKDTPQAFVLYGGTALALRLGHRQSEDFDFFSNQPFHPDSLRDSIPYLKHAEMTQFQDNTLTALVDRNGPVKLSFFGSLGIKRAQDPDIAEENGIQIASLLDLFASKLKTVQSRAEAKDYWDIVALFDAGLSLAEGLGAAAADLWEKLQWSAQSQGAHVLRGWRSSQPDARNSKATASGCNFGKSKRDPAYRC